MPTLPYRARLALALLLGAASLLASGSARAQAAPPPPAETTLHVAAPSPPVPVSPAPTPVADEGASRPIHCGGVQASTGAALVPGLGPGGYVRLGGEFSGCPGATVAPILRISEGFEGWFSARGGGFSLPLGLSGGIKAHAFVAVAGAAVNIFTVDRVNGTVGGGVFSPRANARVGFHQGTFYVDVVGDVQRRWQWKLDDVTMFQAGVTVGVVTDLGDRKKEASARR